MAALILSACQTTPAVGGQGDIDALTATIRDAAAAEGESIGLIPPLRTGAPKADVERQLSRAGYSLFNTGIIAPRPGEPSLGVYGKTMGKGYQVDPCQVRYNITVHFDGSDRLTSAEGSWVDAGCQ
ncbi:hypothetical protein ABAC460_21925 [Asticcacaulis sp. AC460]|uniref:hypothetical protein n=1 Tax=Asticcacaulis sp. AC460 TaxID=1282360 RepID=UPI0003C3AF3A|nr:hypothetical protein [Asticcacaulis sp. AC460]ESQ86879.1 hypothetical protein ABAC460_21925 [Asticcacaulis sp. AC460]